MNSSPIVKISKVPDGDGGRVIAQALSNSPLKFVSSIHGTYAVAWRTFKSGKPNVDDGKMWLLKKVKEYEYEIIQERSVFYANKLAVSENGHIAWVRSEGNRTKIQKFEVINSEGEYIIEDEAVRAGGYSGDKTIAFSESGKTIGILLDNEEPKKNRAFAWDAYNGKPLMASPLYLTSGTNEIKVTDETFTVITYSQLHVTHDFSGAIIEDTRFNKLYKEDNFCYIGFSLDDLPIDQLNYLLSSLNKLMPTIEFEKASKSHRDDIKEIKNTILRMLGEPVMGESEIGETAIKETSLTLSIHGNLYDRINHHVSTGLYGNDAETVAITLLTHALDCVPIRNIFKD